MKVNMHAAKTRLSELITRVEKGERITIARSGRPVAELVPFKKGKKAPLPADDPLLDMENWAFDGPVQPINNRAIDEAVYAK